MIKRCRVCGIIAGGLVSATIPMQAWPEPDLCPCCPSVPGPEIEKFVQAIETAFIETAEIRQRERAGEHIDAETMGIIIK